MKVKTKDKAGLSLANHNKTLVRDKGKPKGLTVKTHITAGRFVAAAVELGF